MSIQNPLWQVHNALWSLLESDSEFTTAVPSMNRIKYTSTTDRYPDKDNTLDADFPCVRIRCIGGVPRPHRTSNSSMIELKWSIEVFSGDRRFSDDAQRFMDVWWAIYKALVNWQAYLYNFTWDGNAFKVRYCRASEVEDRLTKQELHYRQNGWQSVWIGDTDIWFTTTDLTS